MDNCPNFRQLGGYQSRSGGTVKHNLLFRSGSLAELSDSDLQRLADLNLSIIIDFRRDSEVQQNPYRLPANLADKQKQLTVAPGSLAAAFEKGCATHAAQYMVDVNRTLALEHRDAFSDFLHEALNVENGGLLFHCNAGKDRTGIAAALILMALDIPREQIIGDYLLTGEYFVPEEQAPTVLQRLKDFDDDIDIEKGSAMEALLPLMSVRREYIQSALDAVDTVYGNESNYLSEALNFDSKKQQALRVKYLD
nr:tyrosine-protein phosphatase [Pseudomaricurvus alkylphenolicus]